ncbi:MAG: hypothetical protein MJ071_02375 [Oscillospiraceae bacterium]|nr:hypothetical protein [Oscillospiraceae bacterium]
MKKIVLQITISILLTFALILFSGMMVFHQISNNRDFLFHQVEESGTYDNTHDALIKRFADLYNTTSIPVSVYEEAFSEEWTRYAVNAKIILATGAVFDEAAPDYYPARKSITAYFEEYANKNHVIKDEQYQQRLEESIDFAIRTADTAVDVYHLQTMEQSGILQKIDTLLHLKPVLLHCAASALLILLAVLLFLKKPLYWIGTSLFASGIIITVPALYVKLSGLIMRFSIKEYTTYTLVTYTLQSVLHMVLCTGILLLTTGILAIIISMVPRKKDINR